MKVPKVVVAGALIALLVACSQAAGENELETGRKLLLDGREPEAFCAFLKIPGAEHLAARLGRPKADAFLSVLSSASATLPVARKCLLEGDLQLALGKRDLALQCYRRASAGQAQGEYSVEPPDSAPGGYSYDNVLLHPFEIGPGSHRDNWLIRRFIALEAWEEAAIEFARIWAVHLEKAKPYVRLQMDSDSDSIKTNRILVTPTGFHSRALQFALDYAFFLKQRGDTNGALATLLVPLSVMDLDHLPSVKEVPLEPGQQVSLPLRQPGTALHSWRFWPMATAGVSRKEFIRLAYGEFKGPGQLQQLEAPLEKQIREGENRALRLLARIRMHEGRLEEAAAMEFAYIANSKMDALSATIRRGQVYEDAGKLAEAAAEYEKALALPFASPLSLPDPDEEAELNAMMSSMPAHFRTGLENGPSQASVHGDLLTRLERLYGALGKSEEALKAALRRLESSEHEMANFQTLERFVSRFRTAGKEAEVLAWLAARSASTNMPSPIRANMLWLLGDQPSTIKAIAESVTRKQGERIRMEEWKERFRNAGVDPYRQLLQALVKADPLDMPTQLEWLDAQDRLDSLEVIPVLEKLLDGDAFPAFQRGKGGRNRTQFRNYADLACRLLRLYERHPGHEEKIVALGFRILEGAKPFAVKPSALASYRASWNDSVYSEQQVVADTLQALYVFLSHLKKPGDSEHAALLIEKSGSIPLINQVNRLRTDQRHPRLGPITGHWTPHEAVKIRTLGLPEGVRMLSNRDDVRAIAPCANGCKEMGTVWIGTSWGLVRYQNKAKTLEVLQVPTGVGITTFCETPSGLYVGTRDGLFRLDGAETEHPRLIRIGVEQADGKQRDRVERTIERSDNTRTDLIHEAFPVSRLLWWNDALWVASPSGIYRYDPKKRESLHLGDGGVTVGCGKLWGARSVYDPATEQFKAIDVPCRQWRIIGATKDEVWADVYVNDTLRHRPAILDPRTLALTVLPIVRVEGSGGLQNAEFCLLGESNGMVWLAGNNPNILVAYDRAKKELRKVPGPIPSDLMKGSGHEISGALAQVKLTLTGDRGPTFCSLPVPGGFLVGAALIREWQEDNLGHDDNRGMSHHIQDLEGGLFLVDPGAETWRKMGTEEEELTDFYVKRCVRDDDRLYVCSNGGVTLLSLPQGKIIGRLTVSDGLPSNKVEDVARIGERLYLACELGDDGGGLAVLDLKTGLIQTLTKSDGLKCDKIKRLRVEGQKLHILYGTIYAGRSYGTSLEGSVVAPVPEEVKKRWPSSQPDEGVRTFRSSILDTKTGLLSQGDEILPASCPPELSGAPMPFLGGHTLLNATQPDGLTILAGTHGMLLSTTSITGMVSKIWPEEEVVVVRSAGQRQMDEARQRPLTSDIAAGLEDPNPLYRTRMAASLLGKDALVSQHGCSLLRMVTSPEVRERCTALVVLSRLTPTPELLEAYDRLLKDPYPSIRGFAAIQLCKSGRIPDADILREVVQRDHQHGNFPFNIDSCVGVMVSKEQLYQALAPQATATVFALLLESPPPVSDYEPHVTQLKQLAASLNRDPSATGLLLKAHDTLSTYPLEKVRFVTAVMGYAGTNQLPCLHVALQSKDRVVRSNAARACGAIGDPSSIPHLLKALDMESGLARASIVLALGQLKAKEAIPRLTELYIDLQNDEQRRQGGGFMAQQALSFHKAQYESLRTLDTLSSDWDEIKQSSVAAPVDPREREELLTSRIILDAVARTGPGAARDFYRMLAGGKDINGRVQAAIHLALGGPTDLAENVTILKNLLSDENEGVKMSAAVSLLICGEEVAMRPLLNWLEGGNPWACRRAVMELRRVTERRQLAFARKTLESLLAKTAKSDDLYHVADDLLKR